MAIINTVSHPKNIVNFHQTNIQKGFSKEDEIYLNYEYSRPRVADSLIKYFKPEFWDFETSVNVIGRSRFPFPILQIIFEQDYARQELSLKQLQTKHPILQLISLPGGHLAMWEYPQRIAVELNSFFLKINSKALFHEPCCP